MKIEKLIVELREWSVTVQEMSKSWAGEPADLMKMAADKLEALNKVWRQEISEDW